MIIKYAGEFKDEDESCIKVHPSPTFKHPNAVVFLVGAPASLDLLEVVLVDLIHSEQAVAWLKGGCDDMKVMGLDTESWNSKVVLLQMSFQERCVLIRFPKQKGKQKKGKELDLRKLLSDKDVGKVGAELYGDALDLFLDWNVEVNGLLNLTPLYQNNKFKLGLQKMFIKEYNCNWIKDKKITMSDWTLSKLSLAQIKYAALDAWVSYKIGVKVQTRQPQKLVHLSVLDPKLLEGLSSVIRQLSILKDAQKKKFIVPAEAKVSSADPRMVLLNQECYKKRVRKGNEVTIKDSKGSDVKGVVTNVGGKRAEVKMEKIMDKITPGINANNYNERDICIEEQEKVVNKIIKHGGIKSSLLNLLLVPGVLNSTLDTSYDLALVEPLNSSQREAVNKAIKNRITAIHGPPGTGKTTTIACIAQCLTTNTKTHPKAYKGKGSPSKLVASKIHNHPHATPVVVIAARQNVAALNVLHSLIKRNVKGVLLYVSEEYFIEWHEDDYEDFKNKHVVVGNPPDPLSGWRKHNPGYEHPVVVVCTTGCLTASSQGILGVLPRKFETLILDECSQMWLGEIIPILYQNHLLKRLVLVGDHKQLAPFGSSEIRAANISAVSLFEYCLEDKRFACQMLSEQYRMPLSVGGFISNQFYDGKLASCHSTPAPSCAEVLTTKRVLWVDTHGMELRSIDTKSRYNLAEVEQAQKLVIYFTKHIKEAQRVVVITPYEEQRTRIENELKKDLSLKKLFKNQTIVYCVDSYQGREADIVILSLVVNNNEGSIGFMKEENRLNVMLSRVKLFMCVVGNYKTMLKSKRAKQFSSLRNIGDLINETELDSHFKREHRPLSSVADEVTSRMAHMSLYSDDIVPPSPPSRPLPSILSPLVATKSAAHSKPTHKKVNAPPTKVKSFKGKKNPKQKGQLSSSTAVPSLHKKLKKQEAPPSARNKGKKPSNKKATPSVVVTPGPTISPL